MIFSNKPAADFIEEEIKAESASLSKARILGILLVIGAPMATATSIIVSFRYAMFSICTSVVIIGGEAPYLLSLCPAGQKLHEWTDKIFGASEKAYVYGLLSFVGITLFFTISWNILLLIVHVLLGLLAVLYFRTRNDFTKMPPSVFV